MEDTQCRFAIEDEAGTTIEAPLCTCEASGNPSQEGLTSPTTLNPLPIGITARIIAMIGDTAALGASGEVRTQTVAIAQVERWRAWLRSVFLYSRSNGEVWNRTGIENFVRYLIRYGIDPPPPPSIPNTDDFGAHAFPWINPPPQETGTILHGAYLEGMTG